MPEGIGVTRVVALERNLCAELTVADHNLAAGFLHFCDEWDGLLIDKSDPEFRLCSCTFNSDDFDPKTGKLTAQAIEARRAATGNTDAVHESAVGETDAPKGDA